MRSLAVVSTALWALLENDPAGSHQPPAGAKVAEGHRAQAPHSTER